MDSDGYRPSLVALGGRDALGAFELDLAQAMTPAPPQSIEEWLAEVQLITVSPSYGEVETGLQLRAYVDRLGAYPADVTRDVLLGWDGRFFPAWADLKERLDHAQAQRVRMLNAVRHNSRGLEQPTAEPPLTDAQRAETQALVEGFARRAGSIGRVRPAHPAPCHGESEQA